MVPNNKSIKIILILVIISLMSTFVSADSFSATTKIGTARIIPGETASYTLMITNLDSYSQTYTLGLSAGDAPSWIQTPNAVNLEAGKSTSIDLRIKPKTTTSLGSYMLTLKIQDKDGIEKTIGVPLILSLDAFTSGYKADVALNVDVPEKQDPREKLKINVLLRNRNPLDIDELIIEINSDLFSKNYNLSLGPRKELTNEFVFELNPLTEPKEYDLNVKIKLPSGETISEANKKLIIEEYSTIDVEQQSTTNWFYTEDTISLTNNGNHERTKEIKVKAPWYQRIFLSQQPTGEVISEEGKTYVKWNIEIKSTETKTIQLAWNYRPLAILILIILLLIIAYFIFRSPIVLLKEAAVLKEDSEGISEIKVRLFVKNRVQRKLNSITITDILPRITELITQEHAMGSLKPTKVSTTSKKGTILYWDIDTLEPFEERIITYKIKSKLKVVGTMTLPKTIVKFDTGNGKERKTQSKSATFIKN
ncbi:hypothetical protein K9M18_01920 [Candidatus Woesearchaeota archaeon]|nr:hypothetical protein [Candidatus Woesearchaeota archaeon]MCF8014042.1 hypothetical protein [Candidatus Woesearchaeota archaeon]